MHNTRGGVGQCASRLDMGLDMGLDTAERDAHLHTLGDLHAAGRLTVEELERQVQATLAAETDDELAELVRDLFVLLYETSDFSPRDRAALPVARQVSWLRWAGAGAVVASGAAVLTVVGGGSNPAEFCAALGAGALGFATHWGLMTRRSSEPALQATTGAPGGDWGHRPAAQRSWEETTAQDETCPTWSLRQAPHVPPRSLPTVTLPEQRRPSPTDQ